MYRLSTMNGEVSGPFKTYTEAKAAYNAQVEFSRRINQTEYIGFLRIQKYLGDGIWATDPRFRKEHAC